MKINPSVSQDFPDPTSLSHCAKYTFPFEMCIASWCASHLCPVHRHAYYLLRQDVHISLYFTHEIYSRLCCVVCKVVTDASYPACTSAGTNTPTNRLANALSYFAPNFLYMGLECYFNLFSHIRSHLGKDFFFQKKNLKKNAQNGQISMLFIVY